jgi:hypothetical protein
MKSAVGNVLNKNVDEDDYDEDLEAMIAKELEEDIDVDAELEDDFDIGDIDDELASK